MTREHACTSNYQHKWIYFNVNGWAANEKYYLFEMWHPVCQGKVGVPLKDMVKKVSFQKIQSILMSYIKT